MSPIENYGDFFAHLNADFDDEVFHAVFAPDAYFHDPFQEVHTANAIIKIFRHMYRTLDNPKFEILDSIGDEKKGFIRWSFVYGQERFEGVSHVRFDDKGRVVSHIDYWDAASNVYEKIPILGFILNRIKKHLKG